MTTFALGISVALFLIGAAGVMLRRNLLIVLMSLELMLNAVVLALLAFARQQGQLEAQPVALFVLAVAAGEVAVGLALVVVLFRLRGSLTGQDIASMKG